MVVRVCEQRAIACDVIRVTVGKGNLQDRARAARYAALGDWAARQGLNAIATAHHADDQAETSGGTSGWIHSVPLARSMVACLPACLPVCLPRSGL